MASAPGVEFFGLLATRYKYTKEGAWCKHRTRRAGACRPASSKRDSASSAC
jgi:hypothetical protein